MAAETEVVRDKAQSKLSDLWTKEDYWAIWLGFVIAFVIGWFVFFSQKDTIQTKVATQNAIIQTENAKTKAAGFRTIESINASEAKGKITAKTGFAKTIDWLTTRPGRWASNPLDAFMNSQESADAKNAAAKGKYDQLNALVAPALDAAKAAQQAAADASYEDADLNAAAKTAISAWQSAKAAAAKAKPSAKAKNIFPSVLTFMVVAGLFFSVGILFMGQNVPKFLLGFIAVYWLCILAFCLGNQLTMRKWGVGSEAWAIILGMLIANTVGTPNFAKPALQTEFYIKTGLVLLGAEVLFSKVVAIGVPGIFVAWVVTPIVLVTTYIFGQKVLKIESKTLNIVISADMSVCGTSAAIATAAASRAKKEELTLAIGISLAFTAIMMIVMPLFIKAVDMHPVLAGAWIGGTIDATGAVAAAGAVLGPTAMYVAATIKMIQNVLIGVTAFCVAIYWCTKVDCVEGEKVSIMEIWHRFPKFVLGFATASIVYSLMSGSWDPDTAKIIIDKGALGMTKALRAWFFGFAFASIGLATNFRELSHYFKGGKPLILYVCGQSLNLCLTIFMAWIMFFKVFPEVTELLMK